MANETVNLTPATFSMVVTEFKQSIGYGVSSLEVSVPWDSADPELELLQRLAQKRGFNLHKKPRKKWETG